MLRVIGTVSLLASSLAAAPTTESSLAQRTAEALAKWKPRFDEAKLRYLVADEFILAGDGTARQLTRYRDGTVLAAERALEATYFDKRPTEPIVICLFESEGPYRRLAKQWFGDDDVPHYGFYRHADRVMFMNVSTGTGTLVHELTHALIAPDFPTVPSWFNEGLASLYEQCTLSADSIIGLPNWRLPALQRAIRADQLRPLKEMIEDPDFYRRDLVGINYAEARYLMFYLQQKNLLRPYYHRFREHAREDPTGLKSLEAVIAPQRMDEFDKQWRAAILELRFPPNP